jgi:hypothetical protein
VDADTTENSSDPATVEWIKYGSEFGRKVSLLKPKMRREMRLKMENLLYEAEEQNDDLYC